VLDLWNYVTSKAINIKISASHSTAAHFCDGSKTTHSTGSLSQFRKKNSLMHNMALTDVPARN